MQSRLIAVTLALFAYGACAQEGGKIAPLPAIAAGEDEQSHISSPDQEKKDKELLSTKPVVEEKEKDSASAPPLAPLPSNDKAETKPADSTTPAVVPFGTSKTPATFQPKIPFGHATPMPAEPPAGPHTTVATPVVGVDSVEVSEPAPPTPVAPEADPAAQDPAAPTELTAPIFDEEDKEGTRKIVIRVLNKVTSQSTLFKSAPHETVKFGRLEITTETCRTSSPTSQTDYAGLLDIYENLPDKPGSKKQLFHGWMYASSPSIAALEHPIYDVTMVTCESAANEPKPADKPAKKTDKKTKK